MLPVVHLQIRLTPQQEKKELVRVSSTAWAKLRNRFKPVDSRSAMMAIPFMICRKENRKKFFSDWSEQWIFIFPPGGAEEKIDEKYHCCPLLQIPSADNNFPFFQWEGGRQIGIYFFFYLYLMIKASHLPWGSSQKILPFRFWLNFKQNKTLNCCHNACLSWMRSNHSATTEIEKNVTIFYIKVRSSDVYVVASMAVNWRLLKPHDGFLSLASEPGQSPFLPQHVINMDAHTLIHTAQLAWRRPCWWTSTAQASPLFPVAREKKKKKKIKKAARSPYAPSAARLRGIGT